MQFLIYVIFIINFFYCMGYLKSNVKNLPELKIKNVRWSHVI